MKLAVIGCGNMGRAIVAGLLDAGWTTPDQVIVTNPHESKLASLRDDLGVEATTDNVAAAKGADVILLGVKPQYIKGALRELRGDLAKKQLVISIAAGIGIPFIEAYTGQCPVVRSMPNLGVTVRMGATAIAPGSYAGSEHLQTAEDIFGAVGIVERVHEDLMDAVTGLSGTGPMYVFYMIEAMADAGVKVGLPRDVATRLAEQTVRGSARLAQTSDLHPAALKDLVSSPGGTSITALHVMRRQGFAAIMMDAVEAASVRSRELGD